MSFLGGLGGLAGVTSVTGIPGISGLGVAELGLITRGLAAPERRRSFGCRDGGGYLALALLAGNNNCCGPYGYGPYYSGTNLLLTSFAYGYGRGYR